EVDGEASPGLRDRCAVLREARELIAGVGIDEEVLDRHAPSAAAMADLEAHDVEGRGRGHAEGEAGLRVRPGRDAERWKAELQHARLARERRRRDRQQDERKPGRDTHGGAESSTRIRGCRPTVIWM